MDSKPNNLRVYGVLLRDGHVLMSKEAIFGRIVLKFPGGAVESGETPEAALLREFMEEGNLSVTPLHMLHVPGTLFSPWSYCEYTPLFYMVASNGIPQTPRHENLELKFMLPKDAINSGRMAAPEVVALKRACSDGDLI